LSLPGKGKTRPLFAFSTADFSSVLRIFAVLSVILPQKDPGYYESCLRTFSVPELVVEPVRATKETLGKVDRGKIDKVVYVPITSATIKNEQWQERE